jgi:hypothetical protein
LPIGLTAFAITWSTEMPVAYFSVVSASGAAVSLQPTPLAWSSPPPGSRPKPRGTWCSPRGSRILGAYDAIGSRPVPVNDAGVSAP